MSDLKVENAKLRSKLEDLKLKVNYSDSTGFSVQTPVLVSHILQEIFELQICTSNAIVYSITESAHANTSERILDDRTAIDRILETFSYGISVTARVIHLGKSRDSSSRPITVIFHTK